MMARHIDMFIYCYLEENGKFPWTGHSLEEFIPSLITKQYLFRAYYVPDTVSGPEEIDKR